MEGLSEIEALLGHVFSKKSLLTRALTHSSLAYESNVEHVDCRKPPRRKNLRSISWKSLITNSLSSSATRYWASSWPPPSTPVSRS